MPTIGGGVPGGKEEIGRRAYKACAACRLKKRQCDNVRPCSACCDRGWECKDEDKEPEITCDLCKLKKLRCDKKRPCDRCCRLGMADKCQSWAKITSVPNRPKRRQPDYTLQGSAPLHDMALIRRQPDWSAADSISTCNASSDEMAGSQIATYKRPRRWPPSPSAPAVVNLGPFSLGPATAGILPVFLPETPQARQNVNPNAMILSPEHPLAFPKHPVPGWSSVVTGGTGGHLAHLPKSLVFSFKVYRVADHICDQMLANMTPKLLATIIRIGAAMDAAFALDLVDHELPPKPPEGWALQNQVWQDSARCGMLVVRFDRKFRVHSGTDVNTFWSEQLAGLHREEYISRAFAGEHRLVTSELRQLCKMFDTSRRWLWAYLQAKDMGGDMSEPPGWRTQPSYYRMSRNWARADHGPGVLMRVRFHTALHPADPGWMYCQQTFVEVSAAEYEAVRAVDPNSCEGYMIPVVGSKSAEELLSANLAELESLSHLNASPEGRAALDRFADALEQDYVFLFAALDKIKSRQRPGTSLSPQTQSSWVPPTVSKVS